MTLLGDNVYESVSYGGDYGELVEFDLKSKTSTVLYAFPGGTGGAHPTYPLIYHDKTFYGTTFGYFGGSGSGTVFKYAP